MRKYATLDVLEAWRQAAPGDLAGAERRIVKAAHRVAFDYTPRQGYLYVRSRMISSRTNDNHDTFPPDEIEKGYKTFLGKPVFVNHHNANHRRARGVIVAVALHRDSNPDGTPDTWVEGLMEVDAVRFPKLASAILAGRVNRTSMGVDVDWSTCSACGNKATSPAEYCKHLPAMKGKKIRQRNKVTGKIEEKLIHEVCAGLSFFENSLLVEDPADPTAAILDKPDDRGMRMAASKTAAAGEPDFRDHWANTCFMCGEPVAYRRGARGRPGRFVHDSSPGARDYDHAADPVNPDDTRGPMFPSSFGGTRCAVCGDGVRVNLRALHTTSSGGWHHDDGMKRDHPAVPLDAQAVYDSIPGARAAHEQVRQQVRDHLHSQFEQLSGHPLPQRPRGDEHLLPPDPFTAARRKKPEGQQVRGYGRDPRFDGVSLKKDRNGFYVHTHRSRSDSYPTVDDIPDSDINEIRSTGAKKADGGDHPWFMNHPVSAHHIVAAYHDSTDDERALGDRWYSDAHHIAKVIGKGDAALGAGLLSAYSPRTLWPVNMFNASRAAHGDPPGPGTGALGDHQRKAIRILAGEHHSKVLTAPKTAAFAHLIEHGGDSPDDVKHGRERVVIDRHAMSVATGKRLTDNDADKMPIGQEQHYEHVAGEYRKAAGELSAHYKRKISPHQVQAATWLRQVRRNAEEDASGAKGAGGKGRVQMGDNSRRRWVEHHHEHHPGHIPEENMHYHGSREEPLAGWANSTGRCAGCGTRLNREGDLLSARNPHLPYLCTRCSSQSVSYRDHRANPDLAGGIQRDFTDQDHLPPSLSARHGTAGEQWPAGGTRCAGCDREFYAENDHPDPSRYLPFLCKDCEAKHAGGGYTAMPGWMQPGDARDTVRGQNGRSREFGEDDHLRTSQSSRRLAYGETRVPPQVDTLRMDECPVCGEHNVWSGSRCPVCGFVVPPSVFRDPDTSKAKDVREQLDGSGDVELPPDQAQPGAGQPAGLPLAQVGSGEDADGQLVHPDQIAPDGVPTVQGGESGPEGFDGQPPQEGEEGELPPEAQEEDPQGPEGAVPPQDVAGEDGEDDDGQMYAEELICPACGTTFEADAAAQPGVPCPACGMAALHPADEDADAAFEEGEEEGFEEGEEDGEDDGNEGDEDGDPRKEQEGPSEDEEEEDEDEDMASSNSKTAAALAQAQARRIAELSAQNEALSAQLSFLASAAGVDRELAEIGRRVMRRHADILNPASPVPDPPQGLPSETTEQALAPETMDNAGRPGTTPGANSRVPAAQTTTAITPGVEMQTPPATNLIDVTQPIQGTNPSQDGGVPLSQRRIETDVRIDPDPLKAHGPGIGGMGDNGAAFPWMLDAQAGGQTQPGQVKAAALGEADASRRTYASIRLARMRVQAGLAQGEELSVAERIERDAALSTAMIEHEIGTLEQVGRAGGARGARPAPPMQRQGARTVPSLSSVGAAQYAPAYYGDDTDASDLFD